MLLEDDVMILIQKDSQEGTYCYCVCFYVTWLETISMYGYELINRP